MQVVGHEAVGMDGEVACCGGFADDFKHAIAEVGITEIGATLPAAERYEDGGMAAIIPGIKTDSFPVQH